jgi:superfamily II DNA/RNA helicase
VSTVVDWKSMGPFPARHLWAVEIPPECQEFALPRNTFASLGVPEDLSNVLLSQGIDTPFPIQAATLVDGLAGRDVCGRAPTGSGKTLAFGLVIADKVTKAAPNRPTALVLVPTRELAAQVAAVLAPLARARNLRVATVYGGVGYGDQKGALRRGVEILVACPGRLEDLMEQRHCDLSDVRIAVVDEADRMADMGFLPAVKRLLDKCAKDRQTLLFSATLDGDVDVLVKRYQNSPVRHEVATPEDEQGDVQHLFWRAERDERIGILTKLIDRQQSVIVFCRTRHGSDRLAKQLSREGVEAAAIHGSRTQPQREKALEAFQSGRVRALIATDVAARGIHVDAVACVVHYDPPTTHKDYFHRSGRTGRAGADGTVVSFVQRGQTGEVRAIQKALRMHQRFEAPNFADMPVVAPRPIAAVERPAEPKRSAHRRPDPRSRKEQQKLRNGRHHRRGGRPSQRAVGPVK